MDARPSLIPSLVSCLGAAMSLAYLATLRSLEQMVRAGLICPANSTRLAVVASRVHDATWPLNDVVEAARRYRSDQRPAKRRALFEALERLGALEQELLVQDVVRERANAKARAKRT